MRIAGALRSWLVVAALGWGAAASAADLAVVSAAPQGVLAGDEQQRIQVVFSAAMVALGEAETASRPPKRVFMISR